MAECGCMMPQFGFVEFDSRFVGIDDTNGRFGEVSVMTCKACGAIWLHYHVEFEAFSESGQWYRGPITPEMLRSLTPERAVPLLEQLPWYFVGGSYFRSTGHKGSGRILL